MTLCCACRDEDHACTRPFSCECPMCRRAKPKPLTSDPFSIAPFDALVLLEAGD